MFDIPTLFRVLIIYDIKLVFPCDLRKHWITSCPILICAAGANTLSQRGRQNFVLPASATLSACKLCHRGKSYCVWAIKVASQILIQTDKWANTSYIQKQHF